MNSSRIAPRLVTALLASSMLLPASAAFAADDNSGIETVVVSAEKRTEDLQKVPIAVEVLDASKLEQLNISKFNDYINFLPTVSYQTLRPGESQVYMRGVSSGGDGNHSGSLPSVGVYLDEQPVTTINEVLDVHVYDVARIETLVGPQGTLFGASSEAGTLRIITNKPDPTHFEGGYDLEVNHVDHGDFGYTGEGYVNIPLTDKMAVRLVAWHEHDAGYMDNVYGTRTYQVSGITIDNKKYVKKNFNDVTSDGFRAALKVDLNQNWTVTPSVIYQHEKSNGVFDYDPTLKDLQVMRFAPDHYKDEWVQAALTVDGKIGDVNVTYAGAYMNRHQHSISDYSAYSEYASWIENYYTCYFGPCTDPTEILTTGDNFRRQSHELRVQSDQDQRLTWIFGAAYQYASWSYNYEYHIPGLNPAAVITAPDDQYQTKQERVDSEAALFGEVSYKILPKLKATLGFRVFRNKHSLTGFTGTVWWPNCTYKCSNAPNIDAHSSESDHILKVNLTYQVDDNKLVYFTRSEGYRPGGSNRVPNAIGTSYKPDFVTNYELGWKTSWLDNRLRVNGDIYLLNWENFQYGVYDLAVSILTTTTNVGQSQSKGAELQVTWVPIDKLTLSLSGTYTDAKLQNNYYETPADRLANTPQATPGTRMPFVPQVQGTFVGRYAYELFGFDAYSQLSASYTGGSYNALELAKRQKQDPYAIVNLSTGISRDNWTMELFVNNVGDTRAQIYKNNYDFNYRITTNTPRLVGVRFSQRF